MKGIGGVEKVVNKIEVLPLSPNDERIRIAVYRAIYGHEFTLFIMNNGNVTLMF